MAHNPERLSRLRAVMGEQGIDGFTSVGFRTFRGLRALSVFSMTNQPMPLLFRLVIVCCTRIPATLTQ